METINIYKDDFLIFTGSEKDYKKFLKFIASV